MKNTIPISPNIEPSHQGAFEEGAHAPEQEGPLKNAIAIIRRAVASTGATTLRTMMELAFVLAITAPSVGAAHTSRDSETDRETKARIMLLFKETDHSPGHIAQVTEPEDKKAKKKKLKKKKKDSESNGDDETVAPEPELEPPPPPENSDETTPATATTPKADADPELVFPPSAEPEPTPGADSATKKIRLPLPPAVEVGVGIIANYGREYATDNPMWGRGADINFRAYFDTLLHHQNRNTVTWLEPFIAGSIGANLRDQALSHRPTGDFVPQRDVPGDGIFVLNRDAISAHAQFGGGIMVRHFFPFSLETNFDVRLGVQALGGLDVIHYSRAENVARNTVTGELADLPEQTRVAVRLVGGPFAGVRLGPVGLEFMVFRGVSGPHPSRWPGSEFEAKEEIIYVSNLIFDLPFVD